MLNLHTLYGALAVTDGDEVVVHSEADFMSPGLAASEAHNMMYDDYCIARNPLPGAVQAHGKPYAQAKNKMSSKSGI